MNLYVVGVNYKTTPIDIREKFNFTDENEYNNALASIKQLEGVDECALLSTCNRTELHIYTESKLTDTDYIESELCSLKSLDIYQVKKYFYVYEGIGAIKHIMKVAAGMDSMILGEDQILGQFKKAYQFSMKKGTSKAVLNTLSRLAITSSKKIKTRNLTLGKVFSVSKQIGELLSEIFGNKLPGKKALIIGSGEIGCMVAQELIDMGVADIYMTQRSRFVEECTKNSKSKLKDVSYSDRYLYLEKCEIVIGATSSPHYTVTRDMVEDVIKKTDRKHVFIDLAVPRDFDERICQMENAVLYNIDDLKYYTSKDNHTRRFDMDFIQEQIDCHAIEFIRWFQYRNTILCQREA